MQTVHPQIALSAYVVISSFGN